MSNNNNRNITNSSFTSAFIDLATYDELEKSMYGGSDSLVYFVRETRKSTWFTQCPVMLSKCNGIAQFDAKWSVSISRAGDYLLGTWLSVKTPLVELDESGAIPTYTIRPATAHAAAYQQPPLTLSEIGAIAGVTADEIGKWNNLSKNPNGDWMTAVGQTLLLGDPNITIPYCIAWTPNFMHALLEECSITFNDLVAAKFESSHLDFWAAFTVPVSKQAGYAEMIGASLPTAGKKLMPQTCNLPLPFFYSRDSGVGLPTAALPYSDMRINFKFRAVKDLILVFEDNVTNSCSQLINGSAVKSSIGKLYNGNINFKDEPIFDKNAVQVWANYAIVSNEERKRMACAPRNILIEQFQSEPPHTITQKYDKNNHTTHIIKKDIRFSYAVKVLFFALKNISNTSIHCNYSTGIPVLNGVNEDVCTTSDHSFWEKGWETTEETTVRNALGAPGVLFRKLSHIKSIKIERRSLKNGDTMRYDADPNINDSKKIKIHSIQPNPHTLNIYIQNAIDAWGGSVNNANWGLINYNVDMIEKLSCIMREPKNATIYGDWMLSPNDRITGYADTAWEALNGYREDLDTPTFVATPQTGVFNTNIPDGKFVLIQTLEPLVLTVIYYLFPGPPQNPVWPKLNAAAFVDPTGATVLTQGDLANATINLDTWLPGAAGIVLNANGEPTQDITIYQSFELGGIQYKRIDASFDLVIKKGLLVEWQAPAGHAVPNDNNWAGAIKYAGGDSNWWGADQYVYHWTPNIQINDVVELDVEYITEVLIKVTMTGNPAACGGSGCDVYNFQITSPASMATPVGVSALIDEFLQNVTYKFDLSDPTCAGHNLIVTVGTDYQSNLVAGFTPTNIAAGNAGSLSTLIPNQQTNSPCYINSAAAFDRGYVVNVDNAGIKVIENITKQNVKIVGDYINDQDFVFTIDSGYVTAEGWADSWYDAWIGSTSATYSTNDQIPEGKYVRVKHLFTDGILIFKNSAEHEINKIPHPTKGTLIEKLHNLFEDKCTTWHSNKAANTTNNWLTGISNGNSWGYYLSHNRLAWNTLIPKFCLKPKLCNAKNPSSRISIIYENVPRIGFMTTDYYSQLQPYYHAEKIPHNTNLFCDTGLHIYSYSLDYKMLDPLGSTNFSALTNVSIQFELENNLSMCNYKKSNNPNDQLRNVNNANQVLLYTKDYIGHDKMIDTLYQTGNNTGKHYAGDWVELSYDTMVMAINNNILKISGGNAGFPLV